VSWRIDPSHTYVEFAVRHLGISLVRGYFTEVEGTLELRDGLPDQVQARIATASIEVRNPQRTQHLKSADFFDVERYPEIVFRSTGVERLGPGRFRLHGELTMMGRTGSVELEGEVNGPIDDPWGNRRVGFGATGAIDRRLWGMEWGVTGPAAGVADAQVRLTIDAEAVEAR